MLKPLFVTLILSLCCAASHAQTSGGDHDSIQTVAGELAISKVARVQADGVTYNATLNGARFDQLYGSHYTWYSDAADSHAPASRIVIEDFSGGFSDAPSVSLYDFRKKPPVVQAVSDKLDVDDVRWTDSAVLINANDKWYAFSRNKLSPSRGPKK
ncbi:hypothetical protein [Paraburkholderia bannensis]|uniref:hypothetical protein n=1 Tax=Paraburkholderia bannensis TaxID=765414 RepID=UPI002AB601CF|nr:hypothetical protein [Paraburkholderia bannensis]